MDFFQVISDGNLSLLKAVETFSFAKGNRFSTYASWAIMKNFARTISEDNYYLKRFHSSEPELLEEVSENQVEETSSYELAQGARETIEQFLDRLSEREESVIRGRFGLNHEGQVETLKQIGHRFNLSKERIRQIENNAIDKLREFMEESSLDPANIL